MSKKSRRRNKILGALALGIGASKLGMLGGKTASGIAGDKMASARKAMTSDVAMRGKTPIMPKAKPESMKIPGKVVNKNTIKGPFKIFQPKEMPSAENLKKFRDAEIRRKNRLKLMGANIKGSSGTNFGLGSMDGAKKGKMIKARGGGMARMKPTKMY